MARTPDGRFSEGVSGNPRGRPRQAPDSAALATTAWNRIIDNANETMWVQLSGRRRRKRVTRFESRLLELGSGRPRHRASLVAYIRLVRLAARSADLLRAEADRLLREKQRFCMLEVAAAKGSFEDWTVAMDEFIASLPGAVDMTDKQLSAAMHSLRKGGSLSLSADVEMRLCELVEVLNKAMDRNDTNC